MDLGEQPAVIDGSASYLDSSLWAHRFQKHCVSRAAPLPRPQAPGLLQAAAAGARGYGGELRPAVALDALLNDGSALLLDVRRKASGPRAGFCLCSVQQGDDHEDDLAARAIRRALRWEHMAPERRKGKWIEQLLNKWIEQLLNKWIEQLLNKWH